MPWPQADIYRSRGDVATGRELYTQALEAFKALGDEDGTTMVLANLAEAEFRDDHVEQALRLASEALEINARGKNATNLALESVNSAAYCIALGNLDRARDVAREGLRWARQAQDALNIALALQHLALLGALHREVDIAARLIGYVNVQLKELGSEREYTEKWGYEKLMTALHERLSEAEIETLAAEGAAWWEDQAIEEALKV